MGWAWDGYINAREARPRGGHLGEALETNQRRSRSEARWRQRRGWVVLAETRPLSHTFQRCGRNRMTRVGGPGHGNWMGGIGESSKLLGGSSWRRDLEIWERCVHGGGDPRWISLMVVVVVGGRRSPSGRPQVPSSGVGGGVRRRTPQFSGHNLQSQLWSPKKFTARNQCGACWTPKAPTTTTTIQGLPDTEAEPLGSRHTHRPPGSHECHAPGRQGPPLPAPGVLPDIDHLLSRSPIITTPESCRSPPSMSRLPHVGAAGREEAVTLRQRLGRKDGAHRQQLEQGED